MGKIVQNAEIDLRRAILKGENGVMNILNVSTIPFGSH